MQLSKKTLRHIAEMICGASGSAHDYSWPNFPYRSAGKLVEFFEDCGQQVEASGTRKYWVLDVLERLNQEPSQHPDLPSPSIVCVVSELMANHRFKPLGESGSGDTNWSAALADLNQVLAIDNLECVTSDDTPQMRSVRTGARSRTVEPTQRAWTDAELQRRDALARHFDKLSEDEFTTNILVPVLRQLGFVSISIAGHRDKALEFGKDAWMKYRLPTGNWLYFGIQVKIGKLDSTARSSSNVAEILNQVRMMLDHPIFDPENNKRHLLDHVFLVSSGAITKAARQWLGEKLDIASRRTVMFMDRERLLDLAISSRAHLPGFELSSSSVSLLDDDIPF